MGKSMAGGHHLSVDLVLTLTQGAFAGCFSSFVIGLVNSSHAGKIGRSDSLLDSEGFNQCVLKYSGFHTNSLTMRSVTLSTNRGLSDSFPIPRRRHKPFTLVWSNLQVGISSSSTAFTPHAGTRGRGRTLKALDLLQHTSYMNVHRPPPAVQYSTHSLDMEGAPWWRI